MRRPVHDNRDREPVVQRLHRRDVAEIVQPDVGGRGPRRQRMNDFVTSSAAMNAALRIGPLVEG
jgi:hypothetical protein